MTHNQIEYWNLQETKRHNIVGESETQRHNVAGESETNRHNLATEAVEMGKLNESVRHNTVTENETSRHNRETESLGYRQLGEQIRHNTVTEGIQTMDAQTRANQLEETIRHNKAVESIDRTGTTTRGISDVSSAARSWLSTPTGKAAGGAAVTGGIAATIKSASKAITSFDPFIIPRGVIETNRIHPNKKKGDISA